MQSAPGPDPASTASLCTRPGNQPTGYMHAVTTLLFLSTSFTETVFSVWIFLYSDKSVQMSEQCVCVRACVRACVSACVRACVRACVCKLRKLLVCLLCNFCIFNNCSLSFKIYSMCYCVL